VPAPTPLLVVDAANVVGSVPDGWWRDRHGATARLRDSLVAVASRGLEAHDAPAPLRGGAIEIVLVVEGAARAVAAVPGVRVVSAAGSGDDAIVAVVGEHGADRPCFVATADRGLSIRVRRLGAAVIGPRTVRPRH
jgi:hypothetical protein